MPKLPAVGLRIIKTSLSVVLCLLLAHWLHLPVPIYACTAIVIVTRENFEQSFKHSVARIVATLLGCGFALLIGSLRIANEYVQILVTGLGCALTIYFCALVKYPDAAALSAITYLMLSLSSFDDKYASTLTRLIETVVGVVLAITVNLLLKGKPKKPADAEPKPGDTPKNGEPAYKDEPKR